MGMIASGNNGRAGSQNPTLGAADKTELAEVIRLKTELGDRVWPGFGTAHLPIILYNDDYEFLIETTNPGKPWEVVDGDDFQGQPYYRRAAKHPQSFAVQIGTQWAGSIRILDQMNRKIPFKISLEWHVVMILHEAFHAYQANMAGSRFAKAMAVYKLEERYPFKDREFAAAWTSEGSALAQALKETEDSNVRRSVRQFLDIRLMRRRQSALSPELLEYERELEWLEGLAKYVEIKFYELAVSRAEEEAFARYRPGLPYPLRWELVRLERQLGQESGDLRFYLSGMAQARLLDRLSPGWQVKMLEEGIDLEDLLFAAAGDGIK